MGHSGPSNVAPRTVRLERILPGPIERVWDYLVDGEKRGEWLCSGEMEPRVGGKVELEFQHSDLSAEKAYPERFKKPVRCPVCRTVFQVALATQTATRLDLEPQRPKRPPPPPPPLPPARSARCQWDRQPGSPRHVLDLAQQLFLQAVEVGRVDQGLTGRKVGRPVELGREETLVVRALRRDPARDVCRPVVTTVAKDQT